MRQTVRYVPKQYRRHYIVLAGSFDQYLQHFSAKSRSTLLRKVRAFAKQSGGETRWREYRRPEEIEEFYALALPVARKTYQARLLDAALPEDEAFRRRTLELAHEDSVRGYLLFLDGAPIAYIYCPIIDGVLLYQYVGFDPDYGRHSPGTVLQYLALGRLFEEGIHRMFDFTEGEGAHKEFFATASSRCADIYHFRRTTRNLFLLGLHSTMATVSSLTAKALERFGWKSRLKSLLRARAGHSTVTTKGEQE